MNNCTGIRCILQAGTVDPATCDCVSYCQYATPPKIWADTIRAMTDEELAWAYAYRLASCYGCEASTIEDCAKCTLEWLRQEAT